MSSEQTAFKKISEYELWILNASEKKTNALLPFSSHDDVYRRRVDEKFCMLVTLEFLLLIPSSG